MIEVHRVDYIHKWRILLGKNIIEEASLYMTHHRELKKTTLNRSKIFEDEREEKIKKLTKKRKIVINNK